MLDQTHCAADGSRIRSGPLCLTSAPVHRDTSGWPRQLRVVDVTRDAHVTPCGLSTARRASPVDRSHLCADGRRAPFSPSNETRKRVALLRVATAEPLGLAALSLVADAFLLRCARGLRR